MTIGGSSVPPAGWEGDLHRRQELALADVAERGPAALAELLLAAMEHDPAVSRLTIGPLLRALPGIEWLSARDLMVRAGIPDEATPLVALDQAQRSALAQELAQLRRPGRTG